MSHRQASEVEHIIEVARKEVKEGEHLPTPRTFTATEKRRQIQIRATQ